MSYFNIYPKQIFATFKNTNELIGHLTFSLEQYGILLKPMASQIKIYRETNKTDEWQIAVTQFADIEVYYFNQFVNILSNYLFQTLQTNPSTYSVKEATNIEIYLDDIYINMSGPKPKIERINNKN